MNKLDSKILFNYLCKSRNNALRITEIFTHVNKGASDTQQQQKVQKYRGIVLESK